MEKFTVTIQINQEELERLRAQMQRDALLETVECFIPRITDMIAQRVFDAFQVRYTFAKKGDQ